MTKKLPEWEKRANKNRRQALQGIKYLLKNKGVKIDYVSENDFKWLQDRTYRQSVNHIITLNWSTFLRLPKSTGGSSNE